VPCGLCKIVFARRARPYLIGALIGVLSWVTFATMDKALGTSTTLVHASACITGVFAPDHVFGDSANGYYAKEVSPASAFAGENAAKAKAMIDWQLLLVAGLVVGAFLGSRLTMHRESPRFVEHVPSLWQWRFGPSKMKRYAAAFGGGVILLYGARMAGGCTSGHGISGSLQLALSSWTFFLAMFASGVVTAFALFGTKGRSHVA
jgi:uncharacterized membrane protein YedE/YeeE